MTHTKRFATVLMDKKDKDMGTGRELYSGDESEGAKEAARIAWSDPENIGSIIRQYDFALIGGGMKDTEITGPSNTIPKSTQP